MIKIDPKSFKQQARNGSIHDVYTEKRYVDNSNGNTSSSSKPKISLVEVVANRISIEVKKKKQSAADEIVDRFLRRHFVDTAGNVTAQSVEDYLMQTDLKGIILSFWECVTRVWIRKLQTDSHVDTNLKSSFTGLDPDHPKDNSQEQLFTDIALYLGRWNGVRVRVPEVKGVADRLQIATEAVNFLTLPFFVNITKDDLDPNRTCKTALSNLQIFATVKFRYQADLYRKRFRQTNSGAPKTALEILEGIFDYDLLSGEPRHKLLSAMYVPVCPYCNRQYITVYRDEKNDIKTTADLDHFYIKSIYPYLALSLYNFVPSCQICNSRFKGDRDFFGSPHLYPYTQNSNSRLKFSVSDPRILTHLQDQSQIPTLRKNLEDVDTELASKPKHIITVTPTRKNDVEADNSRKTFHLEEVYQVHKDYVYELLLKIHAYDDSKIHDLYKEFPKLFSSEEEVRSMVFGQYLDSEDMLKRPLAKLAQDLLELSKKGKT